MRDDLNPPAHTIDPEVAAPAQPMSVNGRSVFAVETTAAGVAVSTAFLTTPAQATQTPQLLALPALFPDLAYALQQIDRLRDTVIAHFSHAARVGAQVLAAQHAPGNTPEPQAVSMAPAEEPATA